jgi:alpha-glucosidase
MLTLYRRLIRLRRSEPALLVGAYTALEVGEEVIGYIRRIKDPGFMVLLNLSSQPKEVKLDTPAQGHMELSTYLDHRGECVNSTIQLRDDEGVIVRLGFDLSSRFRCSP